MPALPTNLRRDLERTVIAARDVAEAGARQALESITVHEAKPGGHLDAAGRALRNRLRAHARQLGDKREAKSDRQAIDRLTHECAYEHWHRMLFARFLAENDLLVEPDSGVSLSLDLARDLARETRQDVWSMISRFATEMLPQIFRPDDPTLAVDLATETRLALEELLEGLPRETFLADDSLGWVYQFWQSKRKDEVNASGEKITGDTLPAVTQLFTEHYMVLFLLHNTLGAWHAGKVLTTEATEGTETEEELRAKVAVRTDAGDIEWRYLRFVREDLTTEDTERTEKKEQLKSVSVSSVPSVVKSHWWPAAGIFEGWPREAKDLKILDPCCGSGHFLIAAFQLLVRLRMHEEGLNVEDVVCAVLRDNLFGLEIDQRCVQLAAFNVALAAWTLVGRRIELPELHIACSGIGPSVSEEEWIKLAEESGIPMPRLGAEPIRDGLRNLHALFTKAPTLGSLIDPNQLPADLITADYETLKPYLDAALATERSGDELRERAIAAAGMVKAAELLAGEYTLVITNVPYLGRGKQDDILREHLDRHFDRGKADLATAFVLRCLNFCALKCTMALVTPQNWWFLTSYTAVRQRLLEDFTILFLATLGEEAWDHFGDRGPLASLMALSTVPTVDFSTVSCIDALPMPTIESKVDFLRNGGVELVEQSKLHANPDSRLSFNTVDSGRLLSTYCESWQGLVTTDNPRFMLQCWEAWGNGWVPYISSPSGTAFFAGRDNVIAWNSGSGPLHSEGKAHNFPPRTALGRGGVLVSQVRSLSATVYTGEVFANGSSPVIPADQSILPALWCFMSSPEYASAVRNVDKKVMVTNGSLLKVEWDADHWQRVAETKYPNGLPDPESDDPTQWLFHGNPAHAEDMTILQVAVARLLGHRWPPEFDAEIQLSAKARARAQQSHELNGFADVDGIVCLPAVRGEAAAADRLIRLLRAAFGSDWSAGMEAEHLAAAGSPGVALDEWLRSEFFEQHCKVFQNRPFIWHIWDGKKDGFHALVNYHMLAAPDGAGRRLLDKLTHVYLRDWIKSQSDGVKNGEPGAEARLAAAESLKKELEKILEGEPPYDVFVRWKPLHEQPIGWNPDINDGVRLNIRPFMMAKDVGRKGAGILRFKPNCKWDKDRGKEPQSIRPREDFPWFWGWDDKTQDFTGNKEFDGNRWNDLHYTNAHKQTAREEFTAEDAEGRGGKK